MQDIITGYNFPYGLPPKKCPRIVIPVLFYQLTPLFVLSDSTNHPLGSSEDQPSSNNFMKKTILPERGFFNRRVWYISSFVGTYLHPKMCRRRVPVCFPLPLRDHSAGCRLQKFHFGQNAGLLRPYPLVPRLFDMLYNSMHLEGDYLSDLPAIVDQ